VDGCFWHGHDCRNTRPKENEEYWTKKRARNMQHDKNVKSIFESRGWIVMLIWECGHKKNNLSLLVDKLKTVQREKNSQEV